MTGLNSFRRIGAMIILLVGVLTNHPISSSAKSPDIDFDLLYRAAQIANMAYDGKSKILGELKGKSAWVATPGTSDVQYVIGYNDQRKIQAIAVRGTANDTNWTLDKDTHAIMDQKSGIHMHRGFRTAAEAIYRDVKPRLKPGYTTYLTGHSLGGAVAAILGIYLQNDGVKLGRIFTFGQPKFTNVAGARAYESLPLLRVIYQNDTVALLPDSDAQGDQEFAHIGPVINILSGPYYVYGTAEQTLQFSQGSFSKFLTQVSLPDHKMKWYLQGLRDKLNGAKEVSFKDRNKYIVRHKYGTGVETAPAKYKSNFNHHN
ncbi:MAG: lipase family protein [Anderseniella sp.]|jgi:hypothetical protein|nr:lipase family protein [Anderseniella sp.]